MVWLVNENDMSLSIIILINNLPLYFCTAAEISGLAQHLEKLLLNFSILGLKERRAHVLLISQR